MSQKARTHLILAEPSEDLIANEPWSIEVYADGLMDELFADIDQILDGSGNLPSQTVPYASRMAAATTEAKRLLKLGDPSTALPSEYILQTVTVPQIVLPKTHRRPVQAPTRNNPLNRVVVETDGVSKAVSRRQQLQRTLGKLLWVGATLGLAIATIMWVLNSRLLERLASISVEHKERSQQQQEPQLPTTGEVEADLVNYMLGALAVLDKQEAKSNLKSAKTVLTARTTANQTALAYVTNRPNGNLPPPRAANNIPPAPSHSTTLVERIYIPVYQAPSPMRYAPPLIAGVNSLPYGSRRLASTLPPVPKTSKGMGNVSHKPPVKTALNTLQQPAKPVTVTALATVRPDIKPVALQAAPITVRQPPKPLPTLQVARSPVAPPKLPTATAPAPEPAPTREEVASVVSTPAVAPFTHILEGLLELGDKSAALFKIDGVTRRVDMGETIGSSGWTLVDVANGEAIIRRNGEVRSIYAGQKF